MANVDTSSNIITPFNKQAQNPATATNPTSTTGQPATQSQAAAPSVANNDPIPNSGIYLAEQSQAQDAYDQAKTSLLTQRNSLYHQYGLLDDASVDPNSQYGQYQELLGSEGSALDAADQDAQGRGLGTGGLAMQGEQNLRQSQGADQLNFQQLVDAAGLNYSSGLSNASQAYNTAMTTAEQDALMDAIMNGQFNTAPATTSTTGPTDGNGNTVTSPVSDIGGNRPANVLPPATVAPGTKTIAPASLTKIVAAATKANQPISENGAGQAKVAAAKKALTNAYLTNSNKKG